MAMPHIGLSRSATPAKSLLENAEALEHHARACDQEIARLEGWIGKNRREAADRREQAALYRAAAARIAREA